MGSVAQLEEGLLDADFRRVLGLVREHTGIHMNEGKRALVAGRLSRRMRKLGMDSFHDYCELVSQPDSPELESFINAVTTNLTSFFREPHHFEHLESEVVPRLVLDPSRTRVRLWSSACSTGPEPYSMAMIMSAALPRDRSWDWKILATDLDSDVLSRAKEGRYGEDQLDGLSADHRRRFLEADPQGGATIQSVLRSRIVFKRLNLMHAWPMKGPFDAIFCRNVAIYFDKATQGKLFNRMANLLEPGGILYIGHSESLFRVTDRFRLVGSTTYEKIK